MQDITIKNFRCFDEMTMSFRPGINLLIGDNSVGKTSLLRACNLVINSFFSGMSDENTVWKSADNDDFRVVAADDTMLSDDQPIHIGFHLGEHDVMPVRRSGVGNWTFPYTEQLTIEKKSKKNARNLVTGLRSLKNYAATLQTHAVVKEGKNLVQYNPLPVYAYFTTEDIHTIRKFDKEKRKFTQYAQKPTFGYFESFDAKGLLDCWLKRLLVLSEGRTGGVEISIVRSAIQEALGERGCQIIHDMEIRPNVGQVIFRLMDGRAVRTDLLSDGYRRLVSIVVDVAIRCALLNKLIYKEDAYRLTHGTVIIDEIDEHLHPALQVRVLQSLHRTFPKIQFIVSTHAPLVMSSVELSMDNVVYRLTYDAQQNVYGHEELYTYGMDASTIINAYMGQASRAPEIAQAISRIQQCIDAEEFDEAQSLLVQLQERTHTNDPEFTRLSTFISLSE
jgi:predicted ATP-binding protein involved in virulence